MMRVRSAFDHSMALAQRPSGDSWHHQRGGAAADGRGDFVDAEAGAGTDSQGAVSIRAGAKADEPDHLIE